MTAITLKTSWTSAMIACVCGDVFQASGKPDDVEPRRRAWQAAHKDCQKKPYEPKTFWLSFCDADRPEGHQFLGACVIDVTPEEVDAIASEVMVRVPFAKPGAEYIAAATQKAHELGCNPGGEIAALEVPADERLSLYPRGILMDRKTIEQTDVLIASRGSVN